MLSRMTRFPLLLLCFYSVLFAAFGAFSAPAYAASNPFTVTSRSQTVHFPDYIDLNLMVRDSASPITQATIVVSYIVNATYGDEQTVTHSVLTPTNRAGQVVALHDREDTTSNSFVTPGTSIQYHWELQDQAGHMLTDTSQQFVTVDTRFSWHHLAQGMLEVNWYNQPDSFGQAVLKQASANLAHIAQTLGSAPTTPLKLWIYADHTDFAGAIGSYSYEWVGGEAYPAMGQAFFVIADDQATALIRDMPHEMTHLVFAQIEPRALFIPAWFNEGLAVYNQLYHEPAMTAAFQQALTDHTLLPLDQINGSFPVDADKAYLAYAQSWNLVEYMYQTYGTEKMATFLKTLNSPLIDFDGAAKQALGVDVAHLERQWRIHLNQPPTPDAASPSAPVVAHQSPGALSTISTLLVIGSVICIVGIIAGIALVLVTMRQRKRQLVQSYPLTGVAPVEVPEMWGQGKEVAAIPAHEQEEKSE